MNTTQNNKTKNTLLLLTGAIAGAAATYYLNTPKGKQLRKDVYDKSIEAKNTIATKTQAIVDDVKTKSQNVMATASDKVAEMQQKFSSAKTEVLETAEAQVSDFQSGVNRAKSRVKNGTNS